MAAPWQPAATVASDRPEQRLSSRRTAATRPRSHQRSDYLCWSGMHLVTPLNRCLPPLESPAPRAVPPSRAIGTTLGSQQLPGLHTVWSSGIHPQSGNHLGPRRDHGSSHHPKSHEHPSIAAKEDHSARNPPARTSPHHQPEHQPPQERDHLIGQRLSLCGLDSDKPGNLGVAARSALRLRGAGDDVCRFLVGQSVTSWARF
jgi:hypothetical protein